LLPPTPSTPHAQLAVDTSPMCACHVIRDAISSHKHQRCLMRPRKPACRTRRPP
jgi:hypothetical protein